MKPLRLLLDFLSYEGTPTNDPQDAIALKRKVEESNVTEVKRQQIAIPASTTDLSIALADNACDYLMICTDREILCRINGMDITLTFKPKGTGKTPVFMMRGDITTLTITNQSSTDVANVDIISVNI